MAGMFLAAIGFLVDSFDPHLFHQGGDMLSANPLSIQSEKISQHPCPGKGELGSSLSIFFIRRRARSETGRDLVVEAATTQLEHLGLIGQWQRMLAVNHLFALRRPALLSPPSKKSFSNVSCPILA